MFLSQKSYLSDLLGQLVEFKNDLKKFTKIIYFLKIFLK